TSATATATTATDGSPPQKPNTGSPPDGITSPTKLQGPLGARVASARVDRPDATVTRAEPARPGAAPQASPRSAGRFRSCRSSGRDGHAGVARATWGGAASV